MRSFRVVKAFDVFKRIDIGETKDSREIYEIESTIMYEDNEGVVQYEFNSANHGEGLNSVTFEFELTDSLMTS